MMIRWLMLLTLLLTGCEPTINTFDDYLRYKAQEDARKEGKRAELIARADAIDIENAQTTSLVRLTRTLHHFQCAAECTSYSDRLVSPRALDRKGRDYAENLLNRILPFESITAALLSEGSVDHPSFRGSPNWHVRVVDEGVTVQTWCEAHEVRVAEGALRRLITVAWNSASIEQARATVVDRILDGRSLSDVAASRMISFVMEVIRERDHATGNFARLVIDADAHLLSILTFVLWHELAHVIDGCLVGEQAEVNADVLGIVQAVMFRLTAAEKRGVDFNDAMRLAPQVEELLTSDKSDKSKEVALYTQLLETHGQRMLKMVLAMYEDRSIEHGARSSIPVPRRRELLIKELQARIEDAKAGRSVQYPRPRDPDTRSQ